MEVIKVDLSICVEEESYIALGNFDGVHLGHKVLIDSVVNNAKKNNLPSSVLIFKEHTKNTIQGKKQELLTSTKYKYKILEELNIDYVYEMDFNEVIMKMKPEEFVESFLVKNLKIKGIVVGFDYRFGHKAQGNIKILEKLCKKNNIDLLVIDAIYDNDNVISSTRIRNLIREGNIKEANHLLGRLFLINGKVIKGKGLGRTLGFPTANLALDESYVIPKYGVYAGVVKVDEVEYVAAINIGINPTFKEEQKLEAYLLDFNGDLYEKEVEIQLIEYLRPEIKFDKVEDLISQMEKDIYCIKEKSLL